MFQLRNTGQTYVLLHAYLSELFRFAGCRVAQAGMLLFLTGLFQGISLLMLIPLLGLVVQGGAVEGDVISRTLYGFLEGFNIPYGLVSVLGIFLLIIVVEAVFTRYRTIVLAQLDLDFTHYLRNKLYRAIGSASWQFHSRNHSGESMHLLDNSVSKIGEGTSHILQLFVVATQAIVFLAVASQLSLMMTLLMLMTGLLLYLLVMPVNRKIFVYGEKAVEAHRALYRSMADFFSGLKLAKSYNRTSHHTEEFEHRGSRLLLDEKAVAAASASAQMWLRVLTASLLCVLVFIALGMMQMGIERLLVFIVLANRLYGTFSRGQSYWQVLLSMLPSYDLYQRTLRRFETDEKVTQNDDFVFPPLRSRLKLERVSFKYVDNNDQEVLDSISLVVPANTTVAITGESGSGKSTLADILMGLLIPDSGKVFVDDTELTPDLLYSWRRRVAYVPQDVYLFDGTIRSNLQWISDQAFSDQQLWDTLDSAAAGDFIRRMPDRLDTRVGERGMALSGGERQRLALARALLKEPDLLILDEATSALDHKHENRILQALDRLRGRLTVVVITHRVSAIRHLDDVIVLVRGGVESA